MTARSEDSGPARKSDYRQCVVDSCEHPARAIEDKCECHSWSLTYEQQSGLACRAERGFPDLLAHLPTSEYLVVRVGEGWDVYGDATSGAFG